jgi:hypothetical protein
LSSVVLAAAVFIGLSSLVFAYIRYCME